MEYSTQRKNASSKQMILFVYLVFIIEILSAQCPNTNNCICEPNILNDLILYCKPVTKLQTVPVFSDTTFTFYEVTLASNLITNLQANAFKTLNGAGLNTQKLDLSSNPITTINNAAFSGLESNLKILILHVDQITTFPTSAIQSLINLQEIYFKGFNIVQLPTGAFSPHINLKVLSLEFCKLTKLYATDVASQVDSLKELLLVRNKFVDVPKAALKNLNHLIKLDLAQNSILDIAAGSFSDMRGSLEELIISQNGVKTVHATAFLGLENSLKKLSLSNNNGVIDSHLQAINGLLWLQELDLSFNLITSIPSNLFNSMGHLRVFICNDNRISTLTKQNFQGLGSLQDLIVSNNVITAVEDDTFQSLVSLKTLNMDNNSLSNAYNPDIFKGLEETLESLSLTLTGFSDSSWLAIAKLSKLKTMKLSANSITRVPTGTFNNLNMLSTLNLESNNVNVIQQSSLRGLQFSLKNIYLRNNTINTLHQCLFYKYLNNVIIHLDQNPLHCDCQLRWLHDWIYSNSDPNINFWTCQSPSNYKGQQLKEIPQSGLTCATTPAAVTCEDYTLTTTTTTTTEEPTPSDASSYPLTVNISQITGTSMVVQWIVYDTIGITGWQVKCTDILSGEITFTQTYPFGIRESTVNNLKPGTDYLVCVKPIQSSSGNFNPVTQTCSSDSTMPESAGVLFSRDQLQIILGSLLGVVILIVVVIVGVCLFIKWRNSRNPPVFKEEEGESNDGIFVPQVGYQSKRFSKPKDSMLVNMNSPQLDGFTTAERDRILKLFSSSGASTMSMLSIASQRYTGEPESGAVGGKRAGYPMRDSHELGRLDSGEYQEIPADTYDEIPIDQIGEQNGAYNMPYEDDRPKSTGDILGGASNYI